MVKDHLVPHEGNGYRPTVLAGEVVAGLLLLALFVQGLYVFQRDVVLIQDGFLASVLPGVLVSLTNQDRAKVGVEELSENALLKKAAQLKAEDMAAKGYFSHETPDGKDPWYWLTQAGYDYEYAGENLAVNFDDSEDVEEAWMNSPKHRANIVKEAYTEVGIATARGMYKGEEVTFVVQFFGAPAAPEVAVATPLQEPEAPLAPPEEPEEVVVEATTSLAVLGAQETPPAPPAGPLEAAGEVVQEAAASPSGTTITLLSVLAVVAAMLLGIAVASHMRAPYVEGLAGTFALLVVVVGLVAWNTYGTTLPEVPLEGQAASVRGAF